MAEKQKTSQDVINAFEGVFKQVPNLPTSWREVLVKIAPILSLVFGVLGIIAGIGALGLSPVALFDGVNSSMLVLISGVTAIVSSVLLLMAYPHLKVRKYRGWELLFWSEVVGVISSVLALSISSVIGIVIGFYLLFQMKSYYK
jgi:hypothetical protein